MFEVPQSDVIAVELDKDVVQGKSTPRYIRSAFLCIWISIMKPNPGGWKPEQQIFFEFQSHSQRTVRGRLRLGHWGRELASPSRCRKQLNHVSRFSRGLQQLKFFRFRAWDQLFCHQTNWTTERRVFLEKSNLWSLCVMKILQWCTHCGPLQNISISEDC